MNKDQKSFYGIGTAEGILNKSLAKSTADDMARAEITNIFTIYSAIIVRDYIVSIPMDDPDQERKKQEVEESVKDLSAKPLTNIFIVDRWTHPSSHITYSLARLNLDQIKHDIQKSDDVKPAIRDFILENAEKKFDVLRQTHGRER